VIDVLHFDAVFSKYLYMEKQFEWFLGVSIVMGDGKSQEASDLWYISILQYIDTVNKYRYAVLLLENRDTWNTLIEQSVTALLDYIRVTL